MDAISWFVVSVIVILALFVIVVCIALLVDRKEKQVIRIYELRVADNGHISVREKKSRR